MAADFEGLLARTGVAMAPAGAQVPDDASRWDFYSGFWDITGSVSVPIDVRFGRGPTGPATLITLELLVDTAIRPGLPDEVWLGDTASLLGEHVVDPAEHPGEREGDKALFNDATWPIRGVSYALGNRLRFWSPSGRGIGEMATDRGLLSLWYLLETPLARADGEFLAITGALSSAAAITFSRALSSAPEQIAQMAPIAALAYDPAVLTATGICSRVHAA